MLAWRPAMPLVVLGLIVGLIGLRAGDLVLARQNRNATLVDTTTMFQGHGLADLAFRTWPGSATCCSC